MSDATLTLSSWQREPRPRPVTAAEHRRRGESYLRQEAAMRGYARDWRLNGDQQDWYAEQASIFSEWARKEFAAALAMEGP